MAELFKRMSCAATLKIGLGLFFSVSWGNEARYCTKAEVNGVLLPYLDRDMEGVNETRMGLIRRWGEKRSESLANPPFPLSLCN